MPLGWLTDWPSTPAAWATLPAALALYATGVARLRRRGKNWSSRRSASFLAGWATLLIAVCSPLAAHDESFPVHMVQHLLIGMLAPLLFALSAPITLALRALERAHRRPLVRILHSRAARVLAFPPIGALIYAGSLWTLYLTHCSRRPCVTRCCTRRCTCTSSSRAACSCGRSSASTRLARAARSASGSACCCSRWAATPRWQN
ncbi:MAG: cytochrome c oxidase assembly protein [Solirubrobacterales bacterium]|nr:cytochrome c oxidase assembly protein [Solirubrobacterales bacterium]